MDQEPSGGLDFLHHLPSIFFKMSGGGPPDPPLISWALLALVKILRWMDKGGVSLALRLTGVRVVQNAGMTNVWL